MPISLLFVYWNLYQDVSAFSLTRVSILGSHYEYPKWPSNQFMTISEEEEHQNSMVGNYSMDDQGDNLVQIVSIDCMEQLVALWKFRQWLKIPKDDDDNCYLFSQLEPRIQENLKSELNRKDILRVVALQQRKEDNEAVVVGSADVLFRNFPNNGSSICPRVPNDPPHGSIRNVHVDLTIRQCGIGTQIIQYIHQQCYTNKIMQSLQLEVDSDNIAAVQLYTKNGYQIVQEVWDGEGFIMKKSLEGCLSMQ